MEEAIKVSFAFRKLVSAWRIDLNGKWAFVYLK